MDDESAEPKARKACINCRKQKMKCRIDQGNTCRRCLRSGLPCIFVPRANASALMVPASMPLTGLPDSDATKDLLRRVQIIEDHLGLSSGLTNPPEQGPTPVDTVEPWHDDEPLDKLWESSACLERCSPGLGDGVVWKRANIRHLWKTFPDKMPGLHFLPSRLQFSAPGPVLLAAMLYCSSVRGEPEYAPLAPRYFAIMSFAIAQLSIPDSEICAPLSNSDGAEEYAYQVVIGLVLAGLLNEGKVRETGIWISIAYRLVLEHCPPQVDERFCDWRRLFNGVQIVDLEHASLHLSAPAIPIEPPLAALQVPHKDQLYRLSRMMHMGLWHFSGRGLPTIWSCFGPDASGPAPIADSFSPVDAAVIREWARNLDEWLMEFSKGGDTLDQERKTVFRQYVLHRLVVLSIFHPAKGCNLYASSISLKEQHELLISARATLKLHSNDKSIWSNWDLVIISWAALIVIHAIAAGVGEPDDIQNIRIHLDMLKDTNEPPPNLRMNLAGVLEHNLQNLHTPSPSATSQMPMQPLDASMNLDYSWQIFDQAIMSEVMDPFWMRPAEMAPSIP